MKSIISTFTLAAALLVAGCATSGRQMSYEAAAILELIVSNDGGLAVSADNSQVVIVTDNINTVVAGGTTSIPYLIEIMKSPLLSFDGFARCYSASEQILQKIDPDVDIFWQGGCETRDTPPGGFRILPGGRMDEHVFRKQVTYDVIKKAHALGVKGLPRL